MGDYLIVGLSTDEFNMLKHKESYLPYGERKIILESLKYVDQVIPENTWDQKKEDIRTHGVSVLVMGSDWEGKFDDLRDSCEVVYVPRTDHISSTELKSRNPARHVD